MIDHRNSSDVERALIGAVSGIRRLAREADERSEFPVAACERLAGSDAYAYAWYGTLDPGSGDPDPVTVARTTPGGPPDSAFADVAAGAIDGTAPRGRSVSTVDIGRDGTGGRALLAEHGIRSAAVAPVLPPGTGVPYGWLSVYTRRRNAFGEDETSLVGDVAAAVGRGIETVDTGRPSHARGSDLAPGAIARALPELVCVYDAGGRCEEVVTPEYARRLAASDDLAGRHVGETFPDDAAERILDAIGAALGAREVREIEYDPRGAGGGVRAAARIAPLAPGDGRVVFAARPVTGRGGSGPRGQHERLEEFAAAVGHDLRNPLGVAVGNLELAREEHGGDHLDAVADALDRMGELIEGFLSLARDGEAAGEAEPVDLGAAARDCWRDVAPADATLVVDTDRTIRADPGRLRQLLGNLIRNAVEHGSTCSRPEDETAVEHGSTSPRSQAPEDAVEHGSTYSRPRGENAAGDGSAGRDDADATAVEGWDGGVTVTVGDTDGGFYVADDGPGIPEDEREHVFEAGYSTTDGGAGLGLDIVERVAEAHGWGVTADEAEDGGARFEVTGVEPARDGAS